MKTRSRLINIFATLFVALFVLACMAGFAACGGEEPGDTPVENPNVGSSSDGDGNKDVTDETTDKAASLSSISLDMSGAKTEYTIGDEFSSAGLVVTAKYDDNSTKTVTEYTVDSSSYNGEKAGAYGIIVSYSEGVSTVSASYNVTVSEPIVAIALESISLNTSGAKTEYTTGESFTSEGLVVTANYSDNSTKEIASGYVVDSSAYNGSEIGSYGIIVSYTEDGTTKNASYVVTVSEPPVAIVLESISLNTSSAKTEYSLGESFSLTGLVVTASYSDDSTKEIASGYVVDSSAYNGSEVGLYAITVSYTEDGVTVSASYSVTVSEPDPTYQLIYALSLDGESYEVLGIEGEYDAVVIPAEHEGLPVTAISARAFENASITGVTIPETVASIGASAFSGCRYLASVSVPDSVTTLGERAFYDCYNLRQAVIGDGVERIGDYTFYGCSSLAKVTVGKSVDTIGSYAFYACTALSEIDPESSQKLTTIGGQAFCNCSSLAQIAIPDTVTTMGSSCFSGCSKLESITLSFVGAEKNALNASSSTLFGYIFGTESYTGSVAINQYYDSSNSATYYIPNTLERVTVSGGKIMYGAFYGCSSLTSVTLEDSVDGIGDCAFYNCTSLASVTIGENVASIGEYAFYNCSSLTAATISDSVENIGNYAFYDCASLTSVTIGEGVESIGEYAFCDCSSLTAVNVPDSVENIGYAAFSGCKALESITLPFVGGSASASSASESTLFGYIFGTNAYSGGTSVTQYYSSSGSKTYYIPGNLTDVTIAGGQILYGAFYNCSSLTSITISENVSSIGSYTFYNCSSLTSITISDGVTSIGTYAFYGCSSMTSITIPESVESIGSYAFYGCTALTEIRFNATSMNDLSSNNYVFYNAGSASSGIAVTIGSGVTKIPSYLFYPYSSYSPKIVSVAFEEGSKCTSIGTYAFYGCSSMTSVTIPESVESIGSYTFYNCSSLTSLTIGEGVESIGSYAFYGCTALTEIRFNATSMNDLSSDNHVFYNAGKNDSGIAVTIGSGVTKIPAYIFYPLSSYSPKIVSVAFEEGSQCKSIGSLAFGYCSSLTTVTIPGSVKSIGSNAFRYCTSLTTVTIPEGVESIGSYAFGYCYGLTEIRFNATSMNDLSENNYVFYNAGSASSGIAVTIGSGVTKIPAYIFYPCLNSSYSPKIVSVIFEEDSQCASIGSYAFEYCTSLTSVTIPEGVESIGIDAFGYCSGLTEIHYNAANANSSSSSNWVFYYAGTARNGLTVTIGSNVQSIPRYLFYHSNITSVIFEEDSQCASIGNYAFGYCSSLTSVTIPESVESIGSYAFYECTSLTSVYYGGTSEQWTALQSGIGTDNDYLTSATIYYYSETEPTDSGNWWRYDEDGEPVVWGSES